MLPDGGLLVATAGNTYDGMPLNGDLVQLHPDGQLDTSYHATNLQEIHVLADGRVLIAGIESVFGSSISTCFTA